MQPPAASAPSRRPQWLQPPQRLELHPLDLLGLDQLAPAVVELGGAGRGVADDRRGALQGVFQH
jgi:hypothetical protein